MAGATASFASGVDAPLSSAPGDLIPVRRAAEGIIPPPVRT